MIAVLAAAALLAQAPTLRTTVRLVIAPTTVTDRQGRYVDGLTAGDFVLLDSGKARPVQVDFAYVPISLVVAVESAEIAVEALNKVRRIGSMIEPLVIGDRGEAAVVAFDQEVRVMQDFTSDADKIERGLRRIQPGEGRSRLIDGVMQSARMLGGRPANRRRVILLIGETRDRGSEAKIEDAVTLAQEQNVTVYPLTFSGFVTQLTARPGTLPSQGAGVNLLAVFREIGRLGKKNAAAALAQYTGGDHLSFARQGSLERAVSRIGEELHSQYLLSFTVQPDPAPEFHPIHVEVKGRPELTARTRPGYWLATP